MNYKETLFFIAQSLTVAREEKNRDRIRYILENQNIDWDKIVIVSTSHYVLPALFCNFNKVNFLKYLPKDLVRYMEHITNLNHERNTKLLKEVTELNNYLVKKEIKPIFLKGISYLAEGLYTDIAERMIGDIDFLVANKDYEETIRLVKEFGYNKQTKDIPEFHRHYPSLVHEQKIGAIEIHKEMLRKKYRKEFNYEKIQNTIQQLNGFNVLSYKNQLNLSILAYQINDFGYYYNTINLRTSYDVYLLSKKNKKNLLVKTKKIGKSINTYLIITNETFHEIYDFDIGNQKKLIKYKKTFHHLLEQPSKLKRRRKSISIIRNINEKIMLISYAIFYKSYRKWLITICINKVNKLKLPFKKQLNKLYRIVN